MNSICAKVVALVNKNKRAIHIFLTGGFCESDYVINELSKRLGAEVNSHKDARFAGAIGAALLA